MLTVMNNMQVSEEQSQFQTQATMQVQTSTCFLRCYGEQEIHSVMNFATGVILELAPFNHPLGREPIIITVNGQVGTITTVRVVHMKAFNLSRMLVLHN